MLLGLVGVSGIGKTYFKDKISEQLGFKKIKTIRTREPRLGEINNKTGLFMTKNELDNLKKSEEIIYDCELFGNTYAYLKDEILSKENSVFEIHYANIYDWKKIVPKIKTIYILPKDIEIPKNIILERNMGKEKTKIRLEELEEHYNRINTDMKLRNMFDYIVYNNYDKESEEEIIKLVKKITN